MPRLIISIPQVLHIRIEDAVSLGGHASKAELMRHAVSIYLDEQEKSWAAARARRDAYRVQRHSLQAIRETL